MPDDLVTSTIFTMFTGQRSILDLIKQGVVRMDEATQVELDNKLRAIEVV